MFTPACIQFRNSEYYKLLLIAFLLVSVTVLGNANKVYAVQKHLDVTWQYSDYPTLAGFKIYHENNYLCQTENPSARTITCPIEVTQENNAITITAYDTYGNESAHSVPINAVYTLPASGPPVANNAAYSLNEDTSFSAHLIASDPENDPLTYSIVKQTTTGTIELLDNTTGEFSYTPDPNSNGTDSFSFTVSDGTSTSGQAQVILTVVPVNDSPIAVADQVTINEDNIAIVQVLLNDTDIDGDTLTIVSVTNGTNGIASVIDSTIHYVPTTDFYGNDIFTYTITDGTATVVGSVAVKIQAVNDAPIASGRNITTSEDLSVTDTLSGSDIDSNQLTFSIVNGSAHGQVTLLDPTTGSFRYTPQANWSGNDSFTYRVNDGSLNSNTATVAIAVAPVNDSPVAQNLTFSVTSVDGVLNTLAASDVDGDSLIYAIASQPALGQVYLQNTATGNFRYTPAGKGTGTDSFTYFVNDGQSASNTATVTLNVDIPSTNQPPVADAGPDQTAYLGDMVTLSATNSFDIDDGIAQVYWKQIDGPVVTLSDPASYQPTFDTANMDPASVSLTFELTVADNSGQQSTDYSIVNIIWGNQAPVADAGATQNVSEGERVILDAIKSNDTDDGIATFFWKQTAGILVSLSDPYSPEASFTAPETGIDGESLVFELTVADNYGLISKDSVIVNVSWINDPPVADAGMDQKVIEGDSVILDAGASFDSDDGIQSVHWTQTSGVPVTLSNPIGLSTSFTAPSIETESSDLIFMVTVTDFGGLQHSDTVTISVAKTAASVPEVIIGTYNQKASSIDRWFKMSIELPAGYEAYMINPATIKLSQINGMALEQPLSTTGSTEIDDSNHNGILDISVMFDRQKVLPLLVKGDNSITLSGNLFDGTVFEQAVIVSYYNNQTPRKTGWGGRALR